LSIVRTMSFFRMALFWNLEVAQRFFPAFSE
jgi:hypothetical protein